MFALAREVTSFGGSKEHHPEHGAFHSRLLCTMGVVRIFIRGWGVQTTSKAQLQISCKTIVAMKRQIMMDTNLPFTQ